MPQPVIDVRDVPRSLGDATVGILHGVSLAVEAGEWTAVTGPSGNGESTRLGHGPPAASASGGGSLGEDGARRNSGARPAVRRPVLPHAL